MSSSGYKFRKGLLVLWAGVCLAGSGLGAAESAPVASPAKPVARPPTHTAASAAVHTATKPPLHPTPPAHTTPIRRATTSARTTQSAVNKATPHRYAATGTRRTTNHSTAYASNGKGAAARKWQPQTLTGQQRLARLHLQSERVQEIQRALIREGYLQGDVTGQWDAQTREAMLHYQTMNGFPPTGLPEAKSLMKLGLGSHPLPPELDHGVVGIATPGAAQGNLSTTPPAAPESQATPPS